MFDEEGFVTLRIFYPIAKFSELLSAIDDLFRLQSTSCRNQLITRDYLRILNYYIRSKIWINETQNILSNVKDTRRVRIKKNIYIYIYAMPHR